MSMNENINKKKIKLSSKDKKTIDRNLDLCTDTHGNGCNIKQSNPNEKYLN